MQQCVFLCTVWHFTWCHFSCVYCRRGVRGRDRRAHPWEMSSVLRKIRFPHPSMAVGESWALQSVRWGRQGSEVESKGKSEDCWRSWQCIKNHLKVTDVRGAHLCLSPAVHTRFFQLSHKPTSHGLLDTSDMQWMEPPNRQKIEKRNYIRFRGNNSVREHELAVLTDLSQNLANACTLSFAIFKTLKWFPPPIPCLGISPITTGGDTQLTFHISEFICN